MLLPYPNPDMELPTKYNLLQPSERKKVREEYIHRQGGLCWHCHAPLNGEPAEAAKKLEVNPKLFPENFFTWPIHLHHDHNTGMTIGTVHCHCNAVLWEYLDQ